MESTELQQILDRAAYMWFSSGSGPSLDYSEPIGFHRIDGRKPGQEIVINQWGSTEHPAYRYLLIQDGKIVCENRHFANPQDALRHSLDWSEKIDPLPTLRRFEWYEGHFGWAVDGLLDVDAVVIESEPGNFLLRVEEEGRYLRYEKNPAWTCPMDALAV